MAKSPLFCRSNLALSLSLSLSLSKFLVLNEFPRLPCLGGQGRDGGRAVIMDLLCRFGSLNGSCYVLEIWVSCFFFFSSLGVTDTVLVEFFLCFCSWNDLLRWDLLVELALEHESKYMCSSRLRRKIKINFIMYSFTESNDLLRFFLGMFSNLCCWYVLLL